MQIKPILSALRRHKSGTILIALQIALTLAIVCNALFIVHERLERVNRPTGMDESNLIAVQNLYVGSDGDFVSRMKTDVAAVRAIPGVDSAYITNAYPLRQGGWSNGVMRDRDQKSGGESSAIYFADEQTLRTMGVKLIAGRNFNPSEVRSLQRDESASSPQVIVTEALAKKLFPDGSALGKVVYYDKTKPSTIIGIVDHLTVPWTDFDSPDNATLMPYLFNSTYQQFLVRTRPGQQDAVFRSIEDALYASSRMRVIPDKKGIRTFEMVRADAYEKDKGLAILMTVVCAILLVITAAGIVGLSSFWVGQRRKQIGVRRALGAKRSDILSYFLTENFLIALGGVIVGVVLAVGMSQWMFTHFEMKRLSLTYVAVGVVILLGLGQLAVLAPAMRASRVSPVEATRSV